MRLSDDDHRLSMEISRRGKIPTDELRTLMVHRLPDTNKAVLRRPLRDDLRPKSFGVFCEHCQQWTKTGDVPDLYICVRCEREFRMELVVYEEINPALED